MNAPKTPLLRPLQFNLRELLGLFLVVALAVSFYLERSHRSRLEKRLELLLHVPRVLIRSPDTDQRYSIHSNVATIGLLTVPQDYGTITEAVVDVELIRAEDSFVVDRVTDIRCRFTNSGEWQFGTTLTQNTSSNWPMRPGLHILKVSFRDGKKLLAVGVSVIEAVDIPAADSADE